MKGAHGGHFIGYNVQVAVDARHDLIVAEEVVQAPNDRGQLGALAVAAKEALQVERLQAVADKGYHEAGQLEACAQAGIEAFVPDQGKTSGQGRNGRPSGRRRSRRRAPCAKRSSNTSSGRCGTGVTTRSCCGRWVRG